MNASLNIAELWLYLDLIYYLKFKINHYYNFIDNN
jgi:hypothetical protein